MIRNRSFGLFWLCALLSVPDSIAQSGWATTQTGQTEFSSKAAGPARDIYAIDKTGEVKLNLSDGRIEAKITMKNFSLPNSLMQKHYNERYMHTDKFPHATFKGHILNWKIPPTDGEFSVTITGDFTVHGVTRKREFKGKMLKKGNQLTLQGNFETRLEDHNIEIPVLFFTKITEAVQVTVLYNLPLLDQ